MGKYLYQVVMINGRIVEFEADMVFSDEDKHRFCYEGKIVAEFERKNIAGYIAAEIEEDD